MSPMKQLENLHFKLYAQKDIFLNFIEKIKT